MIFSKKHNQLNEMKKIIQDIKVELYKEIESLNKNSNWNNYQNEKFTNRKIGKEDRI